MTQPAHDEPFDYDRWVNSVANRTVRVTAPTRVDLELDHDESEFRPPEPICCGLCGEAVLPIGGDGIEAGHCPNCGFEPGSER